MTSVKYRPLIIGILTPLLGSALLVLYFSWRSGFSGSEPWLIWGVLGLISAVVTLRAWSGRASDGNTVTHSEPTSGDHPPLEYSPQDLSTLLSRPLNSNYPVNTIFEAVPAGIIVTTEDGSIKTFNPAAERLFGCRTHQARGQRFNHFIPAILSQEGGLIPHQSETILEAVHASGRHFPVAVRISEMHLGGKRMYTCMVTDMAERSAQEQVLRDAEIRFREMVETAHDLVWSLDAEGRWTYLNAASKSIYGYTPEEMIGRRVSEFQSPEYKEQGAKVFEELIAGKELVHYEAVHLDRHGKQHYLSFNGKAYLDEQGRIQHISGTARDITEQKNYQQQLYYQAQHDALTGLYNRNYFQEELERLVAQVSRSGAECALFYLDLDQFKFINDTLGHAAGDRLLIECSVMFASQIREGDLLARFGGDEFTLLLYDLNTEDALLVADKLRSTIESYRFVENGEAYNIGCSIGVAIIDDTTHSAQEIMSHADLACNQAKTEGRNRVVLYDAALGGEDGMAKDMGWAARVKDAVEHDRFSMVFQPIISLASGELYGYEALLRMTQEDGSEILPRGFLPAAERFGMIHSVERWSVSYAINHLAQENRRLGTRFRFAINLSGRAFSDEELLPVIERALHDSGLDPSLLTFEITETAAITNMTVVGDFVRKLKRLGCQFALDDFGSGFSSFAHLKQLQVDKVKIDGAFIQGLANDAIDHALVKSITGLAHTLGMETMASAVEDQHTLELLERHGVDYAQGFYIGRPTADLGQLPLNFLHNGCKLA